MRNLGYKILSVIIAILLYTVASAQRNPRVSRDVYVQPRIENLPSDLGVKADPTGFNITVSGPSLAVEAFRGQQVKATLDLSQGQPGVNRVVIRYKNDPQATDVVGPPVAEVVLEKKKRSPWNVDVEYNRNNPHPGYEYKDPVVDPREVQVAGLVSEMRRVDRVVAFVDNNGPFHGTAEVVAQNVRREEIDTVDLDPKQVQVTIDEQKVPAKKALLLSAAVTGAAAAGFNLINYVFDPAAVEVTGTPARLKALWSLSVPVDISGLRESVTRSVTVPLPPGVSFAAPTRSRRVALRLDIRPVAVPSPSPTPTAVPKPTASPLGKEIP
jgi:YbbR domain-containing protein